MYGAGNVVAGKYRIERVLGQGGMGYVVAATHLDLGTPVALKFLHEHMLDNQNLVDRFKREARSSAQLRGENICRVSDVGTTESGQPFIVMELLDGQDLTAVLNERGALPLSLVAEIMQQACLALGEAHSVGIVHRDLKPGNLMLTTRPDGTMCIKVLDFGVAKGPEDMNFSLTQTASVIGSPGYMSPEQLKSSKTADVRSDIWSLGVVMYELVSGHKPFMGESITELALKVALDPMPPLAGVIPWQVEQVITRCLEKEPAKRYHDVADLALALAPFAGPRGNEHAHAVARVVRGANTPVPVAPTMRPASPTPAPMQTPMQAPTSTPTTLRGASGMVSGPPTVTVRRSWKVPVIMAGGAVLGVALALLVVRGHKKPPASKADAQMMSSTNSPSTPAPTPQPAEPAADKAAADKLAAEEADKAAAAKAAADKLAAEKADKAAAAKAADDKLAAAKADKAAASKAAADKLAAEKADKAAAAKAAADKLAAEKADKAAAAKAAADKLAAEKAEKRAEARKAAEAQKAEKLAEAKKAAAKKATTTKTSTTKASTTSTTSTTKPSTQPKDIGDSRF